MVRIYCGYGDIIVMATTELTDAGIKRLPTPAKGSRVYYDATVAGLGARVTAAGSRAYILNYRVRDSGRERRITIGDCADWTIGAARKKVRELRREIDDGGDPLGDLQDARAATTVAELITRFTEEHVKPRCRQGTQRAYETLFNKHIAPHFGKHTKVADVVFTDIDGLHRKISAAGSPYAANRTVATLSKMFGLAVRWGMRADNPCKGVERNYESKRKRYLKGDELARLTGALTAYPDRQVVNILRMLLLTGARSGEVMAMRWADVSQADERDQETGNVIHKTIWTKLASTTKQEEDHVVPLSAPAAQLLDGIRAEQASRQHRSLGQFVFPSSKSGKGHVVKVTKAWKSICKTAKIEGLRIHDLRHSVASFLVSGGASLPLIGAILGHSNPATTARYAHLFMSPQEAAVEKVGTIITGAEKKGAVKEPVPLKPRAARGGRRGR